MMEDIYIENDNIALKESAVRKIDGYNGVVTSALKQ